MEPVGINSQNVGRIAERIVANELEYRGFRVSDLNKEGTSANADLLAAKDGKTWQVQVKGSTEDGGWWFGYGHSNDGIIAKAEPMFNRSLRAGFYKAQVVVLVSVKSPKEYDALILPVDIAEQAAQINLDRDFRTPRIKDGAPKKSGPVWVSLDWIPRSRVDLRRSFFDAEIKLLTPYRNHWDFS
jgi:hypothetical protein